MIGIVIALAVMVVCVIAAGYFLRRAEDAGDVERFQQALKEVETEMGKSLLVPLAAFLNRAEAWLSRRKR